MEQAFNNSGINAKAFSDMMEFMKFMQLQQQQQQQIKEETGTEDKEKLFNMFMMFQNFMNVQQQTQIQMQSPYMQKMVNISNISNNIITTEQNNNNIATKENDTISFSTDKKHNNQLSSFEDQQPNQYQTNISDQEQNINLNEIPPNHRYSNTHSHNLNEKELISSETPETSSNDPNTQAPQLHRPTQTERQNYDDIPIKPLNTNFMELLEQQLANEPESQINNNNPSQPKKKIVKTVHNKKVINVSKPSKNDKKYTYYTDRLQEENNQINDNSNNKHIHNSNINETNQSKQIPTKTKVTNNENENNQMQIPKNEENEIINSGMFNQDNNNDGGVDSNEKIEQIENELLKIKEEKGKLDKIKHKYEKLMQQLQKDMNEYNIQKQEFLTYKDCEMKKIQKEKMKLNQDVKSLSNLKQQNVLLTNNAKKDLEQIELLKKQLSKLQKEAEEKDNENKSIINKQQQIINQLKEKTNAQSTLDSINAQRSAAPVKTRGKSSNQKMPKSKTSIKLPQKNIINNEQEYESDNNNELNDNSNNNNNNIESYQKHKTSNNWNSNNINTNNIGNIQYKKKLPPKEPQKNGLLKTQMNSSDINIKGKNAPKIKAKPVRGTSNNLPLSSKNTNNNKNNNITDIPSQNNHDMSTETYDFVLPEQYSNPDNFSLIKTVTTSEGKVINLYTNNKREVIFPSGVRKEIFNDNHQVVYFSNGDLKQIFPDGKSVYYFHEAKTVQTTYKDGLQVFKFNGSQIEKHFPDGTKQIFFPDGSFRYILTDGYEETHYVDGTIQKVDKEGVITLENKDGTKEVKYPDGKEEFFDEKGEKVEGGFEKDEIEGNNSEVYEQGNESNEE